MGKLENVVKSEIIRLTKKELRAVVTPLARNVRRLKRTVSHLTKAAARLEKTAAEWTAKMRAEKQELRAPEAEVKVARFSPALIRKLRTRLGLSQAELATLTGVSGVAVWSWESGRTRPTAGNRAALVAVRKLGKREAKRLVAEKAEAAPAPKARPAKRRRRAKRRAR